MRNLAGQSWYEQKAADKRIADHFKESAHSDLSAAREAGKLDAIAGVNRSSDSEIFWNGRRDQREAYARGFLKAWRAGLA